MKELDIKRLLVQKLAQEGSTNALASEFPFDFGRRRADLISIADDKLSGYEIKSYFDKLTNLAVQLKSYISVFDYVYVVCDERHLSKVREIAPSKVGIYIAHDRSLVLKRKAKINNRLNKLVMLDVMPSPFLKQCFKLSAKSKFELCQKISAVSKEKEIRRVLLHYINLRYATQTKLFHNDTSDLVTLDDVFSLFSAPPRNLE
ncbi:hypothetical protein CH92_05680 [Stutzerimonas stutzeri]|uniref:Sce7726 family protein n=1 Tax=Stutzerimonas stutzeri TaxID=316 RepID=W8R8F3_STUST|nr:sce7726 family protein [Stutzerimonas stutzeri]AHL74612.1 hypothetical protein CH92_05680 [Stutzerimonas stutzeri]MCQ4329142.1 sce7726 family protein [Stutzerimonas stutzeri]